MKQSLSRASGVNEVSEPGDRTDHLFAHRVRLAALRHELSAPIHVLTAYAYVLFDACEPGSKLRTEFRSVITQTGRLLDMLQNSVGGTDSLSTITLSSELVVTTEQAWDWEQSTGAIAHHLQELIDSKDWESIQDAESYLRNMLSAARQAEASLARFGTGGDEALRLEPREDLLATISDVISAMSSAKHEAASTVTTGTILLVDDDPGIRETVSRYLKAQGHRVVTSANGSDALSALRALAFDVVLLDIVMPELNGYQTLQMIKTDTDLRDVPVVMLSAIKDRESVAHCLALGADDYITKPFDPILLLARLSSSIENKRLKDREKGNLDRLQEEQKRSHELLLNILPKSVAMRLEYGQKMIANHYDSVTVVFCDLVDFTPYSSSVSATKLVGRLNRIFQAFDSLTVEHGVEKIKTIGDAYLAVAGLPAPCEDHAERVARLALDMIETTENLNREADFPLQIRIGLHSGPVTAGVIGKLKFAYDIWGDTVNVASRMESSGVPGTIQVSEASYELLKKGFRFEPRPAREIKGKGLMRAWLLKGSLGERADKGNIVPFSQS